MTHKTHKAWLKVTAAGIIIYALLFFFGTIPGTKGPVEFIADLSSWPLDGHQNLDSQTSVFLSALLGGILFGWGILIWFLSTRVYDKAPDEVRKTVLISAVSWFVIDSLGSIFSGNANNAIANLILLAILMGPLWFTAKE